jgi:hypothetical protein
MKLTAGTIVGAVSVFVWSIFMGVTAGSIGIGALFPQMNLIAKPFVCPNGQMTLTEFTTQPLPTTTYTQLNWYCVDKLTGTKTELDIFPMSLYAGSFYGFVLFLIIAVVWSVRQLRPQSAQAVQASQDREVMELDRLERSGRTSSAGSSNARSSDAQARLDELKELHNSNSITDAEYQRKRAEILKEL